jgi:hypothetical protein
MSKLSSAAEGQVAPLDRLAVFAWLWAVWAVTEQAQWDDWAKTAPHSVFSCCALWLLARPWSLRALGATALSQLALTLWSMPWVSDHALFAALVNLAILLALVPQCATGGVEPIDRERLFDDLAAPIRISVIALYGWAFFHKLNTDWLDPAGSCGATLYRGAARSFGLPDGPAAVYALGVIAPLGIELAIPVLLLVRRTRVIGVFVLMLFHLWLALPPTSFYRFSAAMFALAFLFWPAEAVDVLRPVWDRLATHRVRSLLRAATRVALVVSVGVLASMTQWTRGAPAMPPYRLLHTSDLSWVATGVGIGWGVLAVAMIACLLFVLLARRQRASPDAAPIFAIRRAVLWIPVLLVVLNGATPYLGIKNQTSFAMFSNLRTEGGRTNHLLIEEAAKPIDQGDDLVRIVESTDPQLAALVEHGHRIPWFEFRDHVHRSRAMDVIFEYGGQTVTLRNREDVERHVPAVHRLARKLRYYRSLPPEGVSACGH